MKPELLLVCSLYEGTEKQLDELYTVHRLWQAKDPGALLRDVRDRVRAISTMGAVGCKAELMDAVPKTEIIAWCRQHMAHYKCPRHVTFGPLPKTSTGKIQKFELRERTRA